MAKSKVFKMSVVKGGKERRYKKPYPINSPIPTVRELMLDSNHKFIEAFPGNAEGLVWITRQKVNQENHASFIYAMATYAMMEYNPSMVESGQFRHNLRKLKNKMRNRKIDLTVEEECTIHFMENMDILPKINRIRGLSDRLKALEREAGLALMSSASNE